MNALKKKLSEMELELKKKDIDIEDCTKELRCLIEKDKTLDTEINYLKAKIDVLTDMFVKYNAKTT